MRIPEKVLSIGIVNNRAETLLNTARLLQRLGCLPKIYQDPSVLYDELMEEKLVVDGLVVAGRDMVPFNGTQLARRVKRVCPDMPIIGSDLDPYHWTRGTRQYSGIDAVVMYPLGPYLVQQVATFISDYLLDSTKFPAHESPHSLNR